MGLPTSREENLTGSSQISSALLNKLQDEIIRMHGAQSLQFLTGMLVDFLHRQSPTVLTWGDCRPLGRAGVIYEQTSGNGPTLKFKGGLFVQRSGGNSILPYLAYVAEDDELNVTLGAFPGAAQFRRDIVSVRLVATGGAVAMQTLVTAGVASGTENGAAEPATPAGYTKIACVLLSGAGPGTGDITKLRDYRAPLGRVAKDVYIRDDYAAGIGTDWSLSIRGLTSDGAAARSLFVPISPHVASPWETRLMSFGLLALFETGPALSPAGRLVRIDEADVADLSGTEILNITSGIVDNDGQLNLRFMDLSNQIPVWGNGYSQGYLNEPDPDQTPYTEYPRLWYRHTSASDKNDFLRLVRLEFAGGIFSQEITIP